MATKRQIALAFAQDCGKKAYNRGDMRSYTFDTFFCAAVKIYPDKLRIAMCKYWYRGWDIANINNPNDLDNGQLKD